jgi:acetyl esterase/lipase
MTVPRAILAVLVTTACAAAAEPQVIRLWEGDAPGALGAADHDVPVITWWAAERVKGEAGPAAAFVICPGGGYGGLAAHEGADYARWLNSLGIDAGVLRYRLGSKGYRHPVMLGDVTRAMRVVRHEQSRLGIDPHRLGVIGSSAGGHLALTLLTHGDEGDENAADPVDRRRGRTSACSAIQWRAWRPSGRTAAPVATCSANRRPTTSSATCRRRRCRLLGSPGCRPSSSSTRTRTRPSSSSRSCSWRCG